MRWGSTEPAFWDPPASCRPHSCSFRCPPQRRACLTKAQGDRQGHRIAAAPPSTTTTSPHPKHSSPRNVSQPACQVGQPSSLSGAAGVTLQRAGPHPEALSSLAPLPGPCTQAGRRVQSRSLWSTCRLFWAVGQALRYPLPRLFLRCLRGPAGADGMSFISGRAPWKLPVFAFPADREGPSRGLGLCPQDLSCATRTRPALLGFFPLLPYTL